MLGRATVATLGCDRCAESEQSACEQSARDGQQHVRVAVHVQRREGVERASTATAGCGASAGRVGRSCRGRNDSGHDHQGERERRRVAGFVVRDEGVQTLNRSEDAGLDPVHVAVGVVAEVLQDTVDGDLVDLVEVGQFDAEALVATRDRDRLRLDRDGRAGVVHGTRRRGAGVVVGLVPRAHLDLVLAVTVERRVDREVEHVGVVEPLAGDLGPHAAHELVELHVGLGRVGFDLRDVERLDAVDQVPRGNVDHRLGGVDHEGVRRQVAERVFEDEGVEALDRTERSRLDAVQVGPRVGGERLLDAVERCLDDIAVLVVELEAHLLVVADRADETVLGRSGRTGGVERERVRERVAGDVVDDDRVEALDRTERSRLDAVHVAVGVVAEVLQDTVEGDLVDLAGIEQLDAEDLEHVRCADGLGLDGQRRCGVVDREVDAQRRCNVARRIERVVLDVVAAVGQLCAAHDRAEVHRVRASRRSRDRDLRALDEHVGRGVVDVADDLGQRDIVARLDDEVDVVAVEDRRNDASDDDRLGGVCDDERRDRGIHEQALGRDRRLGRRGVGGSVGGRRGGDLAARLIRDDIVSVCADGAER